MRVTLLFSILLMGIKFYAYYITNSNAILSDALESIINVAAGCFALFCIFYASKPKDEDHPYGHGKIENLSAGFEGALIFIAGISIIANGINGFFHPHPLNELDMGLLLSAFAGICNFLMGSYLVRKGKKYNSVLMTADGKHLISDTISSVGLILGLGIIYFTGILWIDNLLAIVLGGIILSTGFKFIRQSVFNLLDKADVELLNRLIDVLNKNRRMKWIDVHNLRVLKYGSQLHVDCHITLPWYDSLEQAHEEVESVEKIVKGNLGGEIEFFIHADPCLPLSCSICTMGDCKFRKTGFVKKLLWTIENLLPDSKHTYQ